MVNICPCCYQPFETSKIMVSLDTNELAYDGITVRLTTSEAEIAYTIAKASPRYVPRERLFTLFNGQYLAEDTKNIEVHISQIRKRIANMGLLIENMRGVGYRMMPAVAT